MKKSIFALFLAGLMMAAPVVLHAETEEVIFDFENGLQGFEIPDWAFEKPDHLQKEVKASDKFAKVGKQSLELFVEFPGNRWTGGIVEIMQYFDWSSADALAFDVYLPKEAPAGLKVQMILTVGDSWKWVEMARSYDLVPGQWVTVKVDLLPGSIDWRRVQVDDAFRKDVRKMDLRIFTNGKPAYTGPVYFDNIRLIKK